MWKCREIWFIFLLGLFLMTNRCEGRAVNISNTWTLPQDGFAVFYRFFRDKISWFEADAVCQFHHANLVTVDNGQQFDAAREFIKELDVTEAVWIGLMRPQNSERFTWSNSKPLASTSGYWAESLPLIESPLCAVIDPVRDFRWHALRCGGPETASFLCEMNVPNWATECTIQGIPGLTIQYMADSGSVELSKDCGEEGTLHQICKGKQDRERIIKELICKSERNEKNEDNSIAATDLADTHHKSLQLIKNMPTDNNEDNNINIEDQKEEERKEPEQNPVQKLIEQFNVEELMQADQPQETTPEIIPKPIKKIVKKAKSMEKKDKRTKKIKTQKEKKQALSEEMMMGDQPIPDINQIQEPLPHIKKSLPQDLRHHEILPIRSSTTEQIGSSSHVYDTSNGYSITSTGITEINLGSTTLTTEEPIEKAIENTVYTTHTPQTQTTFTAQNEELIRSTRVKESNDNHFIPPMLLVKSHYTSTKSHWDDQNIRNNNAKLESTTARVNLISTSEVTTPEVKPSEVTAAEVKPEASDTTNAPLLNIKVAPSTLVIEKNIDKVENISIAENEKFELHPIVPIKTQSSDIPTTFPVITHTVAFSKDINIVPSSTTEHLTQQEAINTQIIHHQNTKNDFPSNYSHDPTSEQTDSKERHSKEKNRFSNEENFQPYKPNRRRSLTKPEATSYLKKILG